MTPPLAYLRADVSKQVGLGHISRAVAMAKTLRRNGIQSIVYTRELDKDQNYAIGKLHETDDMIHKLETEEQFLSLLDRKEGKYLFIDLLEGPAYAPWIPRLKQLFPAYRTICFDAFFDSDLPFNLYVRPLFDGTSEHVKALTGLKYYVFGEKLRELAPTKKMSADVRRVLITLGGSDPHQATAPVVQALCRAYPKLHFTVVIGPSFAMNARQELENLSREVTNMECALAPDFLGTLYMRSDFAVTSGGLTKFETALFGIPSILLANSPQEDVLSKEFADLGGSVYLGRSDQLNKIDLKGEFGRLITQKDRLEEMSRKSRQLLDIHGGERILDYIKQNLS